MILWSFSLTELLIFSVILIVLDAVTGMFGIRKVSYHFCLFNQKISDLHRKQSKIFLFFRWGSGEPTAHFVRSNSSSWNTMLTWCSVKTVTHRADLMQLMQNNKCNSSLTSSLVSTNSVSWCEERSERKKHRVDQREYVRRLLFLKPACRLQRLRTPVRMLRD